MLENLRNELIGKELNCLQLDNKMQELGFYEEYEAYTEELLESGVVVYTMVKDPDIHYRIEFNCTVLADTKEEDITTSCLVVTDVTEY